MSESTPTIPISNSNSLKLDEELSLHNIQLAGFVIHLVRFHESVPGSRPCLVTSKDWYNNSIVYLLHLKKLNLTHCIQYARSSSWC
jgi:hypothetical protein